MQRKEEISVPLLTDMSLQDTKKSVWIKSPSGSFQAFLGCIGFGVIVLYVKSSQNCAADSRCIDQILAMLPQKYSTATLIVCGGVEFALTSAVCAMGAVPAFLKQIKKHKGIQKFVSGGGIITLAGAAAMESMLIVMKAFPSVAEALLDFKPWISLISSYPLNLYGVANIFSKDVPRLVSKGSQWVGRYKGEFVIGNESYQHLRQEYNAFRVRTGDRYKLFVAEARRLPSTFEQKPLTFLYETKLHEIETKSDSWLKRGTKNLLGAAGLAAALGSGLTISFNTYNFLANALLNEKQDSSLSTAGVIILAIFMGLPRIRTITEKTVTGAISLVDLNQHLHYQLNPKTTILSWLIGLPTAYFSYAVLKDTALRLFTGAHQQLAADMAGFAIEFSHFVLSLQLVNLLLTRFSKNGLYKVHEAVQEVLSMTLEEFDDFVKTNESQLELYQIKKMSDEDSSSQHEQRDKQMVIPSVVIEVNAEQKDSSGIQFSPKEQRWAHKLCSWWYKKEEAVAEEKTLQGRRSLN
jgi:hypothetical protein